MEILSHFCVEKYNHIRYPRFDSTIEQWDSKNISYEGVHHLYEGPHTTNSTCINYWA